jgi:hypothetical protein
VLASKLSSLKKTNFVKDTTIKSAFISTVNSIYTKSIDRNLDIIDFYNFSFGRFGKTKELYLRIWNNYFTNNYNSIIFPALNDIVYKIMSASRSNKIDSEMISDLATIIDFYKLVHDYIKSKYFYPNKLSDNPILEEEFKQIIYLINLILTPAIRNILLNQIYSALREMDASRTMMTDQNSILDEIVNVEFNGETIDSYLNNILPKLAIKYFSKVYNNDNDIDKKIINSSELFLPIVQIIKSIRIVQITNDSLLVQNLNEYLIPFMTNTYQSFIHYIRLSIYGYEKYLMNSYQLFEILQILIK